MEATLVLFVTFPGLCLSVFQPGDGIIELNETTFGPLVETSTKFWIVEFYKTDCDHCHSLVLEFKKIFHSMKNMVKLGAVNIISNADLKTRFQIQGVPTIKIFGLDKNIPINYSGPRNACPIIETTMDYMKYAARSIALEDGCQ